jgi:hypothetical protein
MERQVMKCGVPAPEIVGRERLFKSERESERKGRVNDVKMKKPRRRREIEIESQVLRLRHAIY